MGAPAQSVGLNCCNQAPDSASLAFSKTLIADPGPIGGKPRQAPFRPCRPGTRSAACRYSGEIETRPTWAWPGISGARYDNSEMGAGLFPGVGRRGHPRFYRYFG